MRRGGPQIDIAIGLLAVALLIAANGFFVLGEFALVTVDRSKIDELVEDGRPRARSVQRALKTLSFQLSGAQLGITISSLLLGFIIESAVADVIRPALVAVGVPEGAGGGVSLTVALVLATTIQMVVGELMPKNLAIARPLRMALWTAGPLRFVNTLLRPLILFLNNSANATVRLLGIEPQEELASVHSVDELQLLIESSREQGTVPEEAARLLARSISFGKKTAADALIPRTAIKALPDSATVADLTRVAAETGHSRFPVYHEDLDDVLGFANVRESFRIPYQERPSAPIITITRDALVTPETRSLDSLLHQMRAEGHHAALVVDEYGGTAGVITVEDLIEEIVGEIEDEHDPARRTHTLPFTGTHLVDGMLHPAEVLERTGFEVPEGDYETLAGFLLTLFDRIPEQGDQASYGGWELKVVRMDRRRIDQVLLVAPQGPPDQQEAR